MVDKIQPYTTYEGTKAIKDSKLQRHTTSLEEIKMEEDESFDEWTQSLILGKPFSNPRLLERCLDLYPRDFMPSDRPKTNWPIVIN